jgi:hypothetical protein
VYVLGQLSASKVTQVGSLVPVLSQVQVVQGAAFSCDCGFAGGHVAAVACFACTVVVHMMVRPWLTVKGSD